LGKLPTKKDKMEYIALIILIIFLVTQIFDFLLKIFASSPGGSSPFDNKPLEYYEEIVNNFIRKEASIEILQWITERRNEKYTSTMDSTFVSQITNGEEVKKRVSIITNLVAMRMSPEIHAVFNRVHKKNLHKIDKKSSLDIALREYIARYVFFMFRRLTCDIMTLINSVEYESKKIDTILNLYIVGLEKTVYDDNKIVLIKPENLEA
jgi:hypothetical protein